MPMLSETGKHNDGGEVLSAAVPILTNKTKYKFHYSDCPARPQHANIPQRTIHNQII